MKHKYLFIALLSSLLCSCALNNNIHESEKESESITISERLSEDTGEETTSEKEDEKESEDISESEKTSEEEPSYEGSIQDTSILHAWNWKMNDIKSRLSAIKNAGYGAIQISPMQPKVDKTNWSNQSTSSQWWKLYQPLAFKISEDGENFLGTRSDLASLCSEAKRYGLKIIVDVVSNHLAGTNTSYSDQVYKRYPLHSYGKTNDDSVQAVVQGHIGLPDLDTSNKELQKDVLSMLKDYIDCGISGFRFDAAKHIETPDDGEYASDYWPYLINGVKEYAKNKNIEEPYCYGEILTTCGKGRSFSSYTSYMSVVDNKQGTSVVSAVNNKSLSGLKETYNTGVNPDHLVLWAESHDTYANDSGYDITRSFSSEVINKAYIIQTSRKDASSLYFARPDSMGATICTIKDDSGWKNNEIAAINKFHRSYVNEKESINNNNNCFVNVRGTGDDAGAVIVNINASETQNVEVKGLNNGTYLDLISNKEFSVNNEKVNVTFTNGACILVPKDKGEETSETISEDDSYYSSVVLENRNENKSYLAWVWSDGGSGHWKEFSSDHNAIGITLSSGDNYIIVEFPSGTTLDNANWDNKERQTIDYKYQGSQIIHDYNNLDWK